MPTPRAGDGEKGGPNQRGSSGDLMLPSAVQDILPTPRAARGGSSTETTYLLGTPTARDHKGSGQGERLEESERRGQVEAQVLTLIPTPLNSDAGPRGGTTGFGLRDWSRALAVGELLPTTTTTDAKASGAADYTTGHAGTTLTDATVRQPSRWGKYAAAIARWERITRPAPEPTNITDGYLKALAKRLARMDKRPAGMRGSLKPRRQLAARFSEWMMGLALGWITDVPGITRNEALKAAGNGVVPQQAAEALRFLIAMPTGREIAAAHEPDDLLELLSAGGAA